MVHKKYIIRGGKKFGPYLYENYRENGVTKTRYLGKAKPKKNFKHFFVIPVLILFALFLSFSLKFFSSGLTGNFIEDKNILSSDFKIVSSSPEIILGEPVLWNKKIYSNSSENIILNLPKDSSNVSVKKIESFDEEFLDFIFLNSGNNPFTSFFNNLFLGLTGNVIVSDSDLKIEIDNVDSNIEVEYETPAPYSLEEQTESGKKITVVGPESVHYENILSFTELPKEVHKENIKLYRTTDGIKEDVDIVYLDENNNSLIDKIEWVVPHLSNQTYELIIEAVSAVHLDSNKNFVSDIYNEIKRMDYRWSDTIYDGEYVRVQFEEFLTNENDITSYFRITDGEPLIEIYEKDSDVLLARSNKLYENEYTKLLLENLTGIQDTFDVKVINGEIEFDQIIDPNISVVYSSANAFSRNDKIVRDSNGWLHMLYVDASRDISYWNSTDEGLTWNGPMTFYAGTAEMINLVIDSNDNLYTVWRDDSYDILFSNKSIDAPSWQTPVTLFDGQGDERFDWPGIAVDSNDYVHVFTITSYWLAGSVNDYCIYTNSTDGGLTWYNNSEVVGTGDLPYQGMWVNNNSEDDSDFCDIEVDTNDNVYIACAGTDQDDVDIWSSKDNFASRNEVHAGTADFALSIAVNPNNDNIYIVWNLDSNDLGFANATSDAWNGVWSSQNVDADESDFPVIEVSQDGDIFVLYEDPSSDPRALYEANSTDEGLTWDIRNTLYADTGWAGNIHAVARGSTWSTNNRITDRLDYIYWNDTDDSVYFDNFTIAYTSGADVINPDLEIIFPINNSNSSNVNLDVNYTASDDTALFNCWYTNDTNSVNTSLTDCGTNITTVSWSEGMHNVTIWANDTSGNLNQTTVTFRIDLTNPVVNIDFPFNNTNTSNVNLDVNYTRSDDIFVESCWYSNDTYEVNTTLVSQANVTSVVWSNGNHNVTVWCNDSSGNEDFSSISFFIDLVNPDLEIITPVNNSNSSNVNLDVNYTASDNIELFNCWYTNDTNEINTTLETCGTNITDVVWSEGEHNITIWANDTSGNLNQTTFTFTIDLTNPDVLIEFPTNNSNSSNVNLDVNFTRSDDVGLGTCWYSNDTYEVNTTLVSLANVTDVVWVGALHNVTVWCNDSAGNENSSTVSFNIDLSPPYFTKIKNISFVNSSSLGYDIDAFDFVEFDCFEVDDTSNFEINCSGWLKNATPLDLGDYEINITINDSFNNLNSTLMLVKAIQINNSEFAGVTTDFETVEDISNISNLTLDETTFGSINFTDFVNLENGTDLDDVVNISFNRVEVNSSANDALNKSAHITLRGLTFSNPRPLLDGAVCPASICTENSYSGGTFIFTVSHFSVYSSEETPTTPISTDTGGSSGGSSTSRGILFTLSDPVTKQVLLNNIDSEKISITNNEASARIFSLSVSDSLKDFVSINSSVEISSKETKDLFFEVSPISEVGIYTGRIYVSSGNTRREILITLEVVTEKSFIDVSLLLPSSMKEIKSGDELNAQINLLQKGIADEQNVTLKYMIKDFDGNIYYVDTETVSLENQDSINKIFDTGSILTGDYILGVELSYDGGVSISSSYFSIVSSELSFDDFIILIIIGIMFCIFVFIFVLIKRYKKIKKHIKR